jgi:hypothetical protein
VQLIDFLNENQTAEKGGNSRSANTVLSRLKETIDNISVKPEKGRRKDLRRIEQAIRSMRKIALLDKNE